MNKSTNDKKEATRATIQKLISSSEKTLAEIELSLPLTMELRKTVFDTCQCQEEKPLGMALLSLTLDTILAEHEVTYDLSASLNGMMRAEDDYTRKFFMQMMNLCFWEAFEVFVGSDNEGLLKKMEGLTQEMHLAGCELLAKHIISDIMNFRKSYADRELRNITRHYDSPIVIHQKLYGLNDMDKISKGASQLMAIRMEISVVSSYLLKLLVKDVEGLSIGVPGAQIYDVIERVNDTVFEKFSREEMKISLKGVLSMGQQVMDGNYSLFMKCEKARTYLAGGCKVPDLLKKLEALIKLRMEAQYLQYDMACAVWGYVNSETDEERSQNLRLIHITKQAALTHIYGYNDKTRQQSLWTKIKEMKEANSEALDTEEIERLLEKLTKDLDGDNQQSRAFAHYRHKDNFYIPERLEALKKMLHHQELEEVMALFGISKKLVGYTEELLKSIKTAQDNESRRMLEKWTNKIDGLIARMENNKRAVETLKQLRNFIDRLDEM